MRALVQRVAEARVDIAGTTVGKIDRGLLAYLGVGHGDDAREAAWLAEKIANLRVFSDDCDRMNRDVKDIGGGVLVISQFTLFGDVSGGRRPSFTGAMPPEPANKIYEDFVVYLRAQNVPVETGRFGADMQVYSLNDGPITLMIDSPRERAMRNPGKCAQLSNVGSNVELIPEKAGGTRAPG